MTVKAGVVYKPVQQTKEGRKRVVRLGRLEAHTLPPSSNRRDNQLSALLVLINGLEDGAHGARSVLDALQSDIRDELVVVDDLFNWCRRRLAIEIC